MCLALRTHTGPCWGDIIDIMISLVTITGTCWLNQTSSLVLNNRQPVQECCKLKVWPTTNKCILSMAILQGMNYLNFNMGMPNITGWLLMMTPSTVLEISCAIHCWYEIRAQLTFDIWHVDDTFYSKTRSLGAPTSTGDPEAASHSYIYDADISSPTNKAILGVGCGKLLYIAHSEFYACFLKIEMFDDVCIYLSSRT